MNKRKKSEANSSSSSITAISNRLGTVSDDQDLQIIETDSRKSSQISDKTRQISDIGMGLRLKLENYADVLRGMMQQVILIINL